VTIELIPGSITRDFGYKKILRGGGIDCAHFVPARARLLPTLPNSCQLVGKEKAPEIKQESFNIGGLAYASDCVILGLKIRWGKPRGSSTLPTGTIKIKGLAHIEG
jgi:hypothetical protein